MLFPAWNAALGEYGLHGWYPSPNTALSTAANKRKVRLSVAYDPIGNLSKDVTENISNITWNVYGKITTVTYSNTANSTLKNLYYYYDASGNRMGKRAEKYNSAGVINSEYTWYVRDASGNVMATYSSTATGSSMPSNLALKERHVYGSSRLGIFSLSKDVKTPIPAYPLSAPYTSTLSRGYKFYELTNHLGNVLVTLSDKKPGHSTNGTTIDYYDADQVSASDYYPFGATMPSRSNGSYRYGFNGKEKEKDGDGGSLQIDYGFRIYDPHLGRFKSVDPLISSYPYFTPYQFAGNMPIAAIDLDGLEQHVVIYYKDQHGKTTEIQVRSITDNYGTVLNQHVHKVSDTKDIAKGNVLVFESYQKNKDYENMKIIERRNTGDSKLTQQEQKIFYKYKEKEKETGETQTLGYGGYPKGESQYQSQEFENADTKTYSASFGIVSPSTFQGQTLSPNKKLSLDAIPVYGDQSSPPPSAVQQAENLGKALKNTGISSVIIQPTFRDASGGEGANTIQRNGKTFIQNYYEQYQQLGQVIKKASGGNVNVTIQFPKISKTSLAGKGLDIQTK